MVLFALTLISFSIINGIKIDDDISSYIEIIEFEKSLDISIIAYTTINVITNVIFDIEYILSSDILLYFYLYDFLNYYKT